MARTTGSHDVKGDVMETRIEPEHALTADDRWQHLTFPSGQTYLVRFEDEPPRYEVWALRDGPEPFMPTYQQIGTADTVGEAIAIADDDERER